MTNINIALEAKKDKILNKLIRFDGVIMTRLDWLRIKHEEGCFVKEGTKNRIQFDRRKFNRFDNYKDQEEHESKCNEKVTCYKLYLADEEDAFYEITKTEFDFFETLKY